MIPDCKQSSMLLSQAQDQPLRFADRLRLRMHLLICERAGASASNWISCASPYGVTATAIDRARELPASARVIQMAGHFAALGCMVEAIHRMRVEKMEPKRLRMVHSKPGSRGDFVLVEGVKGGGEELPVLPPLSVYREGELYSEELEALFRDLSGAAG